MLPELPNIEGLVVFHRRTPLILRAFEHPISRRGVFFDLERFQHRAYVEAYGERMLNADARVLSREKLVEEPIAPNDFVISSRTTSSRFLPAVFGDFRNALHFMKRYVERRVRQG